jgi:hypothetical protein
MTAVTVMAADATVIAGVEVPSASPLFLGVVGIHVLVGLIAVIAGVVAMLSAKRPGRHPRFGTIYFWSLAVIFASATFLSFVRWAEDYDLFILGALSFGCALGGRTARRHRWHGWVRWHISSMGLSYILLLTAFYVDNGHSLPLWRNLPPITYWLLPGGVGIPIIGYALLRHPLVRERSPRPANSPPSKPA